MFCLTSLRIVCSCLRRCARVKAYDLETAADKMKPLIGSDTIVLPVLNGIDIADRIGAVVGLEHVFGGLS